MSKIPEKITVKITKTNNWYVEGETHEVLNHVTFAFGFGKKKPCFEKKSEIGGIYTDDCIVLSEDEKIPEYTMLDIEKLIGHKFKIVGK